MQNDSQVEKIIHYLQGKIANLKERLKAYESPIMQDMAKTSPHLQMDYIRITTELQANEDNLLAIENFTQVDPKPEEHKPSENGQQSSSRKKEKAAN